MSEARPYDPPERRARFDRVMQADRREYQEVIDCLTAEGLPTVFTQTGGMNAALEVTLEAAAWLSVYALTDLTWEQTTPAELGERSAATRASRTAALDPQRGLRR